MDSCQDLEGLVIEAMLQDISRTYWGDQAVQYAQRTGWDIRYGDPEAGAAFTRPWPWKDIVLSRGAPYLATRGRLAHELMHVWLYKGALVDSIEQEYNCDFHTHVILMHLGSLPEDKAEEWFGVGEDYLRWDERYELIKGVSLWHSKLPEEQPTGIKVIKYAIIQAVGLLRGEDKKPAPLEP